MDLRDLQFFETIATLEHIGQATSVLHRTQPALTSCVKRLESAYGAALFERSGRGIKLTQAGSVLLKWARRMRFDINDARQEIADLQRGLSGQLRIGIVPTAAQFLLPKAVKDLVKVAPDLTLKTVIGLVDMLQPKLLAGEIDLMVATESPIESGFTSQLLAQDYIVVAASIDHKIHRSRPSLKELTLHRWVLQPPGAPTRDWLDHTFDRKGLARPNVQVESSMLLMHPALIAQTGLLSFISRHHLGRQGDEQLKEVPLRDVTMKRRMVVTYRDNGYLAPSAQLLISALSESAKRRRT